MEDIQSFTRFQAENLNTNALIIPCVLLYGKRNETTRPRCGGAGLLEPELQLGVVGSEKRDDWNRHGKAAFSTVEVGCGSQKHLIAGDVYFASRFLEGAVFSSDLSKLSTLFGQTALDAPPRFEMLEHDHPPFHRGTVPALL